MPIALHKTSEAGDVGNFAQVSTRSLGLRDYAQVFDEQRRFTDSRSAETPDELWFLEHPPVFTQGQAGKPEHVLFAGDIPVVQSDRGGQVTYHGPGQLVVYTLVDLERLGIGIRSLVSRIENALVALLAAYGITAYADPAAPGVYVGQGAVRAKIASLGLRVRKNRSYHGLALNVDMDLSPYARINPCGYAGQRMTQLKDLGVSRPLGEVAKDLDALLRQHLFSHS